MTQQLDALRDRLQQSQAAKAEKQIPITIDIRYGYVGELVSMALNPPSAVVTMTISQTKDMIGKLQECITAVEKARKP